MKKPVRCSFHFTILVRREIFQNGPIPVSFIVYPDFSYYRDGIYSHVKGIAGKHLENGGVNPWEPVSHSVTIVGWVWYIVLFYFCLGWRKGHTLLDCQEQLG